jgi:release factor glutamine methyltransferase
MTISALVKQFHGELAPIYSRREAEQLTVRVFEEVKGFGKIELFLNGDSELGEAEIDQFTAILEDLKKEKPVQQIFGKTVFYGLPLRVSKYTLIPRPETEELVHWILKNESKSPKSVLDLGTCSGCIALALKNAWREAHVSAIDSSVGALNTAKENARENKLEVEFFHFDILKQKSLGFMQFDLLVSNPPYVRASEMSTMMKNVLYDEPHSALFVDDNNPLIFYRRIVDLADGHLRSKGKLYFEINEALGSEVEQLMRDRGFDALELKNDLNGRPRMVSGQKV